MTRIVALAIALLALLVAPLCLALNCGSPSSARAQIVAPIVVTVNGSPVTLTAEDREAIARASAAVRAALPNSDRQQVDWQTALTASQRTIVGSDPPEQWLPQALITRWRSAGGSFTRAVAADQMEIAGVARRVLNQ